jgi:membrane protein DedA with SNARE-associated domain
MDSGQLPGIFGTLEPVLSGYGYLAVAGFVLLEDFGVPLPGETILIAGAVYAGTGRLNVIALGVVALVAAVVGDNVGFAIGHFGGRPLVLKWGRYVFLTEQRLTKAEEFFRCHGGKVVTVARFVEGLRQANGIVAGISRMHWARFLGFNVLGAALWCALWVSVGYVAGSRIGTLYHEFHHYEVYVGVGVAVLVIAYIGRKVYQHRRRSGSEQPSEPPQREPAQQ